MAKGKCRTSLIEIEDSQGKKNNWLVNGHAEIETECLWDGEKEKENTAKKLFSKHVRDMEAFISESLAIDEFKIYGNCIILKMSSNKMTRNNFWL